MLTIHLPFIYQNCHSFDLKNRAQITPSYFASLRKSFTSTRRTLCLTSLKVINEFNNGMVGLFTKELSLRMNDKLHNQKTS